MRCSYDASYGLVLPAGSGEEPSKPALLKRLLEAEGLLSSADLIPAPVLDMETLARVHERDYLGKLEHGSLSEAESRRMGLTWSSALWERARHAAGGTLNAARAALKDGMAANLAGGGHHAFADRGEGFCVLNDVAIAVAQLKAEGTIERAVIIDLDVHQGNGTAAIFERDKDVFTFSMHAGRNYPLRKMSSTLDVSLEDGTSDAGYLQELAEHLPQVLACSRPEIAFYIAGVDVARGDRFGRLALSEEGIYQRDLMVLSQLKAANVPVAIVLGGGYQPSRQATAKLHVLTFRAAASLAAN